MFQENTLATAARAHDDEDLAPLDPEVYAFENRLPAVALSQTADLDTNALLRLVAHF
jgi:hypothetical protein